jgi:ribose transport system substrate-binding protein
MKRRTLLTLVLAVLCIVSLATSSFGAPKKTKDFVIGFANGYFGNNWRAQFIDDAVAVADKWKARGIVKEFIVQNVNDDVTKQIVQLNSLIDQGVDCLIINPVSAESLAGVVRRAKQMGVLIVNADDPAAYAGTYSVCGDHRAFIGIQAKWLSEQLKSPAKVVHVHGLDGNSCDKVRMDETRGILAKNPNVDIIAEAPGGWNETKAQDIMSNWLSAYPKIDAVMTQDIQAEGILRAYDIAGKPYPVMTGDYNMGFFRKWAANPKLQTIGVTYNPGIGGDAVEVAIRLLMGWKFKAGVLEPNQVNPKLINTVTVSPAFVITKEAAPNGAWLKGYNLGDFTKKISLAEAIKLGEGKPDAYLLDGTLEDSVVDALFDKPAGWNQSWE